jgi:hypothetical protein
MKTLMICTAHQILSGDQIKNNEMGRKCSTNGAGEMKSAHWVFVGKPEGKRRLGITRHR